jgi:hypothetical protein
LRAKLTYSFILFAVLLGFAQQQNFNLEKGKVVLFKHKLFAYGFKQSELRIYLLDLKLKLTDSSFYKLEKSTAADYLSIDCDTLHGTLNVYLQKKDKLNATLLRYTDSLKLVNEFKNVEITKLSPLANFDQQKFIYRQFAYVVKSAVDTGGKLFYLSKFEFTPSNTKPFDYKFKWQFNFEKKHIGNIHVFYADTNYALAYVSLITGERKGQWVLKINAATGLLIKAKKLSNNQSLNYRFANFCRDTISKELFVLGQLTAGDQLASPSPTLFILQFDSLLSLTNQKQVVQKITPANPKAKTANTYIFQVPTLETLANSTYAYTLDLFKSNGNEFKYVNSARLNFSVQMDEIVAEPVVQKEYLDVENYYFTQDKKDLNGKLFKDTTVSTDRLFYKAPVFAVNQSFKTNENELPVWLLKKNDIKLNSINYALLQPGLKVYETKSLYSISKNEDPNMILLNSNTFLLFHTKNNSVLHLELGTW